ncbi:MAG: HAD hydrolase family protein [Nitrospinae bacterium]|nr:HAD hydrolase family protein [Nitrospinota bacterium]
MRRLSSAAAARAAAKISLVALDVDGVLTDGKIIINDDGGEAKNFHVRDGMAIVMALKHGLQIAVISGRRSKVVEHRARELGIRHVYQGAGDKLSVLKRLLAKLKLTPSRAAFMGDDINDLEAMGFAGFSAAPADADSSVLEAAAWVSSFPGGGGAVRELIRLVMTAQGKWPSHDGKAYSDEA